MSFFEQVLPAERRDHWTRPEEQVPAWLADERLDRRERAVDNARKKADHGR